MLVMTNPTRINTRTSSGVTVNRVVKIRIAVNSRTLKPANVIGRNPAIFATG